MTAHLLDLTHELKTRSPVFPGDREPSIAISHTIGKDGYQDMDIHITTHTGTHIDCPRHIYEGRDSVSDLPVEAFYGRGLVIDCTYCGGRITGDLLQKYAARVSETDFLLLHTGWDKYWGTDAYFRDFPVPDAAFAEFLVSYPLRGVGIDAASVDGVGLSDLAAHRLFLENGLVIIENLWGLDRLPQSGFHFSCFPLKISGGDGSPVRAVAYLDDGA